MAMIKNGKTMISHVALLFIFLMGSSVALAQVKIQTTISSQSVEVGEGFRVGIEVSSEGSETMVPPEPPKIDGALLRGQGKEQRLNATYGMDENGEPIRKTVLTQIYNFTYIAEKNGDLVIPSVEIKVGDKIQKSSPGIIKVYAAGAGGKKRPQPRKSPFGDDEDMFSSDPFERMEKMEEQFNQLLQRRFGAGGGSGFLAIPNINEKDAFFIVAEVDKTEVYKGEQIVGSWYLYTKAGVREIDTLKYPELKGFWKEDIELATLLNFQQDTLNGQPYNKALLASYALFPIDEGKATIDPYKAKVVLITPLGQAVTATKSSESIPVLVKPLPVEGRPADFSGAVGEYQMRAEVENVTFVAHQPFLLRVRFEGKGNAKQFELPNLNLNPAIEVYDVKNDAKYFKTGTSYKEFEVFLIPRQAGPVTIPAITSSYFNPRTQKYESLSSQEIKINVLEGSTTQTMAANRIDKDQQEAVVTLAPITQWEPSSGSTQWKTGTTAIVVASVAHLGVGVLLVALASIRLGWFERERYIEDYIKVRMGKIDAALGNKEWRQVGVESVNLVYYVLGELSGLGGANVHIDKLLDHCPPSVRRNLSEPLKKSLEHFYLLGFGPEEAQPKNIDAKELRAEVKKLESLLNKSLKTES
ncbi:MAG: BatD family protein [Bdellovibrionales bacterium]|nr:BatD family protein [Bdellovibrionales bacterium]